MAVEVRLARTKWERVFNSSVDGTGWGAGLMGGTNNGALQTTLNEGGTLSAGDTTITLTSTTGIVANDVVLIGGTELVLVGGISSNNLTDALEDIKGRQLPHMQMVL